MKNMIKNMSKINKKRAAAAAVGGTLGGVIGSSVGIAMLGTAFSGVLPFGIAGAWLTDRFCRKWTGAKEKAPEKTLFEKIIDREIDADIVYEDDLCIAFNDIAPQAPVHVLVVPKKTIPKVADATEKDRELLGHLLCKASEIARTLGCGDAFRLVINNGADAGQSVFHLHVHILGKRPLSWPPG